MNKFIRKLYSLMSIFFTFMIVVSCTPVVNEIGTKIVNITKTKEKLSVPVFTIIPPEGKTEADISDSDGNYYEIFEVSITSPDENAVIWYTFDGSTPSKDNKMAFQYSAPVSITRYRQIKAISYVDNPAYKESDAVIQEFKLKVRPPVVSWNETKTEVILDSTTDASIISYSFTGQSADLIRYVNPVSVPQEGYVLYSIAEKEGWADSSLVITDKKAPGQISSLNAKAGKGSVILNWTDPGDNDFESVTVQYNSEILSVLKGIQSLLVEGLDNGLTYSFTFTTVDSSGNVSAGKEISATPSASAIDDIIPAGEVTGLILKPGNGSAVLQWTDPEDNDFVYVSIQYNSTIVKVPKGQQSLLVEGLNNGTEYSFTVKTVDSSSNFSTGLIKVVTPSIDAEVDLIPPGEVSAVVSIPGNKSVTLTWTDPGVIDFDKVEIVYGSQILSVNKGKQSLLVEGLENGIEYTFIIKTIDTSGNKSSGIVHKATPESSVGDDITPPAEVTALFLSEGTGKVTLTWADPVDSDFYQIEIGYNSQVFLISKGTQIKEITGLTNGVSYLFTVKTIDTTGNKSVGVEKIGTPQVTTSSDTTPPGNVTGLTATPGSGKVLLKWTDPGDPDLAKIEISYTGSTEPVYVGKNIQVYEVSQLENGKEYNFTIKSIDTSSNISSGVSKTCTPVKIAVTSVTLIKETTTLLVNGKETLSYSILPSDATDKGVIWSSGNTAVASVSSSGEVTGIATGTAIITIKTVDGEKTAMCTVTVTNTSVSVSSVACSESSVSMIVNDKKTLIATITPANATNQNIIWSSSNSNIVTVSQTGELTAIATGTATITVTTEDGGKTAICTIVVNNPTVYVESITLDAISLNILIGSTETLTPIFVPSNATNKNVTWSSDNEAVASVGGGVVTAVAVGTAKITVTSSDGGKKAYCDVTVTPIPVVSVALNKNTTTILAGFKETLSPTITPVNATNKNVTWSSLNTAVATVDGFGEVTAKTVGEAAITVTTVDGSKTATCIVTVTDVVVPVTGITLNKSVTTLDVGGSDVLISTILPLGATNQNVIWLSKDTQVVTVSNGQITALKAGIAIVSVTTEDGGKTAECSVTVNPVLVTGVNLNSTTLSLITGDSGTLVATVLPDNATNKNVTWTSSNTGVAIVDNGLVTAIAAGSATITTTTQEGSKTATCSVTVTDPYIAVTGVEISKTSTGLVVGGNETLTATILPSGATNKAVTWSSSDSTKVTVDSNGKITGIAVGTSIVTVTSTDGAKTASCTVTVNAAVIAVTGVSINKTIISNLLVTQTEQLTATVAPADATNQNVIWTSSDSTKVSVTTSGLITAVAAGTAIITVTSQSDGTKKAECTVTVPTTYSVSYNGNSNSGGSVPSTVMYATGNTVTVAANTGNLVRTGYTFAGWNTKSDGTGTNFIAGSGTFVISANTILYARWNSIEYEITYNLNGGTNHADNPANYTIATATIVLSNPTRTGYTFAGWYDNASFLGTAITQIAAGSTGNKVLYAKWNIGSGGIGFDFN